MSLLRIFSKPHWQSKDPSVRRDAVGRDDDPALLSRLPSLAREDEDGGVRLAALKRLADPGLCQTAAHDDADPAVRKSAALLLLELLSGTHAKAPSLSDRMRLLRAQDEQKLLEHVALNAPEAELRLTALQRVERMPFVLDRVTADADSGVRLAALGRIDDERQLERISERSRKSDKAISRLAAERAQAMRIERGDANAIATHARDLCEQFERLLREGGHDEAAETLCAAWARIADRAPANLTARFQNARDLNERSRDPLQLARLRQQASDRAEFKSRLEDLERQLHQPDPSSYADLQQGFAQLEELHARIADGDEISTAGLSTRFARVGAQISALAPVIEESAEPNPTPARTSESQAAAREASRVAARHTREVEQKQMAERLQVVIEAAAKAIDGGHSAAAHEAHAEIAQLRRKMQAIPASLREALADVESEYARIRQWQDWGDRNRRAQLLEEMERLPAAGLHPDALSTRVREIQTEWANLNRIEGGKAAPNAGMEARFHALCRDAFKAAKPYFEKRAELRKQGSGQVSEFIGQTNTTLRDENLTPRDALRIRHEAAQALHGLDRVDPRERKALASELKQILAAVDERIKAANVQIENDKDALITKAIALAELGDTRQAMAQARDLQKRWQASGNGRRNRDQAQWKAFRSAIDAVFARADNERAELNARQQQALDSAARLCSELETLIAADNEPERSAVHALEAQWRELGCSDSALRKRFQSAQEALQRRSVERKRRERRAQFDDWLAHYCLCRRLEQAEIGVDAFVAEREQLPPLRLHTDAMQARIQPWLDGQRAESAAPSALRDCVLELESLAGIEPPEVDRQRRMDLQMEKLSARMRGQQAVAAEQALQSLLSDWLQLGTPDASSQSLDSRFQTAVVGVLDTLG